VEGRRERGGVVWCGVVTGKLGVGWMVLLRRAGLSRWCEGSTGHAKLCGGAGLLVGLRTGRLIGIGRDIESCDWMYDKLLSLHQQKRTLRIEFKRHQIQYTYNFVPLTSP
jgi:hypothetical protein